MTSWRSSDIGDDPDARATDAWLVGHTVRRGMEQLDDWLQRRPDAEPAWRDAAESSDYVVDLSPDDPSHVGRDRRGDPAPPRPALRSERAGGGSRSSCSCRPSPIA
jgi:hypothetical protein